MALSTRPGPAERPAVPIAIVKADGPGARDRVYLEADAPARRLPVHVAHDLPHLAVESVFGLRDGLWAELAAGRHHEAARAATAREAGRQKRGRIVSGAASGTRTEDWLTFGHRRAKALTNAVANRFGDGPDTPDGVRDRVARSGDPAAGRLLAGLEDGTLERAIAAVRELDRRWLATPPGETLRLTWPLS